MIFEFIALLVLTGIAKVLATKLEEKATNEYQLFLEKSKEYAINIRKAKQEIEREIRNANMNKFHELCNLHYRSIQIANNAKKALDHSKNTLNIFYETRFECYRNMDKLSQDYLIQKKLKNKDLIEEIKRDQASLKELKKGIHNQIDVIKGKSEAFYMELKDLNYKTRELKFHIKECGSRGEEWFIKINERTNLRKFLR